MKEENMNNLLAFNEGREGKTMVNLKCEEIPGSVYLGGTSYAIRDGKHVTIEKYNHLRERWEKVMLNGNELNHLLRV